MCHQKNADHSGLVFLMGFFSLFSEPLFLGKMEKVSAVSFKLEKVSVLDSFRQAGANCIAGGDPGFPFQRVPPGYDLSTVMTKVRRENGVGVSPLLCELQLDRDTG